MSIIESLPQPVQESAVVRLTPARLAPTAGTAAQVASAMGRLLRERQRCVTVRNQLRAAVIEAKALGGAPRAAAIIEAEAAASVRVCLADKRIATYERGVRGLIRTYRSRAVAST